MHLGPVAISKSEAEQLIDLLITRAPALHAAGVTSLSFDGFSATIREPAAPALVGDAPKVAPPPRQHIDPLKDASSYPGGKVPGFDFDKNWNGRP